MNIVTHVGLGLILLGIAGPNISIHAEGGYTSPAKIGPTAQPPFSFSSAGISADGTNDEIISVITLDQPPDFAKMKFRDQFAFELEQKSFSRSRKFDWSTRLRIAQELVNGDRNQYAEHITSSGKNMVKGMLVGSLRDAFAYRYLPVEEWENVWDNSATGKFFARVLHDTVGNSDVQEHDLITADLSPETLDLLENRTVRHDSGLDQKFGFRARLWKPDFYTENPFGRLFGQRFYHESRIRFDLDPFNFGGITFTDQLIIPTSQSSHLVLGGSYRPILADFDTDTLVGSGRWEIRLPPLRFLGLKKDYFSAGATAGVRSSMLKLAFQADW